MVVLAGREEKIEWVTDRDRFSELADAWDRLCGEDTPPFADHTWFKAWWQAFGPDRALRVCLLWRGGDLCAALPLAARRSSMRALANLDTPSFLVPARDDDALYTVVDATFGGQPEEVTIHAVPCGDRFRERFVEASARHQRVLFEVRAHRSPRVVLEGDFDRYSLDRRSRLKNINKQWRNLARDHLLQFRFAAPGDELDAELQRGLRLEASGWKGRAATAILYSADQSAFYMALARAYHAKGELRLSWLDVDGAPAAFILTLVRNRRVYGLKAAYDERLRRYSPGLLIMLRTIERCFELGLVSYELLGDDDPWKAYFANAHTDHVRLRSYNRRPRALTRYAIHRAGESVAQQIVTPGMKRRIIRPAVKTMRDVGIPLKNPDWHP